MDTANLIKKNLIERIQNSNDLDFLQTVKSFLDDSENSVFQLSKQQEEAIEISRTQIKNGDTISHEKLMSDMKQWLPRNSLDNFSKS